MQPFYHPSEQPYYHPSIEPPFRSSICSLFYPFVQPNFHPPMPPTHIYSLPTKPPKHPLIHLFVQLPSHTSSAAMYCCSLPTIHLCLPSIRVDSTVHPVQQP
ncbi:hypothetical protein DPMN_066193 [Dreissena polymorpha]|uniref:Uncharacterized protein n=1 Tax=Dreissena polymorpha TaxID=45954 RepID=A0A9D4BUT8_DREPO|nr:hypothetical protein DPMN_066193 [Dreissena polymorpha]